MTSRRRRQQFMKSLYVTTCTYICIVVMTMFVNIMRCCTFPSFLQTNETAGKGIGGGIGTGSGSRVRDWRTRLAPSGGVRSSALPTAASVTFEGDQMKIWTNETTVTRVCLELFVDGMNELFLVSHKESQGRPQKDKPPLDANNQMLQQQHHDQKQQQQPQQQRRIRYACIRFVVRTEGVFQVRSSQLVDRLDRSLCTNISGFSLEPWLIVDQHQLLITHYSSASPYSDASSSSVRPCDVLRGGFSVRISGENVDKISDSAPDGDGVGRGGPLAGRRENCDKSDSKEVLIEANCDSSAGSALDFYVRYPECVPRGLFSTTDCIKGCNTKGAGSLVTHPDIDEAEDDWRRSGESSGRKSFACLSEWIERQYTFSLLMQLQQEDHPIPGPHTFTTARIVILRIPTKLAALDDAFTAYIFTDLVAPTVNYITDADAGGPGLQYRLDVVRNIGRPVTSLCVDEEDGWACSGASRDSCSEILTDRARGWGSGHGGAGVQIAMMCARSCGVCNATRPVICTFPAEFVGEWADASTGQRITFNQTVLELLESDGVTRESFHCIQWDKQPSVPPRSHPPWSSRDGDEILSGSPSKPRGSSSVKPSSSYSPLLSSATFVTATAVDLLLVAGYHNGCRPRYRCVRVLKKSASILYFRFSQSRTWPLTDTAATSIDCRLFTYDVDPTPAAGFGPYRPTSAQDGLRTKHFRLLYSLQPRTPVSCHLPPPELLRNFSVVFSDGGSCEAGNLIETASRTQIMLSFPGCRLTDGSRALLSRTFDCIMSSRSPVVLGVDGVSGFEFDGHKAEGVGWSMPGDVRNQWAAGIASVNTGRLSSTEVVITRSILQPPPWSQWSGRDPSVMETPGSAAHGGGAARIHCWIFVDNGETSGPMAWRGDDVIIYLVDVSQCNESSKRYLAAHRNLDRKYLVPLATFSRRRHIQSDSSVFGAPGASSGAAAASGSVTTRYISVASVFVPRSPFPPPSSAAPPSRTPVLKRFQPDDAAMKSSANDSASLNNHGSSSRRRHDDGENDVITDELNSSAAGYSRVLVVFVVLPIALIPHTDVIAYSILLLL